MKTMQITKGGTYMETEVTKQESYILVIEDPKAGIKQTYPKSEAEFYRWLGELHDTAPIGTDIELQDASGEVIRAARKLKDGSWQVDTAESDALSHLIGRITAAPGTLPRLLHGNGLLDAYRGVMASLDTQALDEVVELIEEVDYQDTDGTERTLPPGTVGRVESRNERTGEVCVAFGDNSFVLDASEVRQV